MAENDSWPLPPIVQIRDFLNEDEHRSLLTWVVQNADKFYPATTGGSRHGTESAIRPEARIALTTSSLGTLRDLLERRMREIFPRLQAGTRTNAGFSSVELEIAAHGDGAHYVPHLDISHGEGRQTLGAEAGEDRVLSAVYYFYRQPKNFTGGELRIYRFNADPRGGSATADDYVDIEPVDNMLVGFPSWALHEVRRVQCPKTRFNSYRFALNCWYCRKL